MGPRRCKWSGMGSEIKMIPGLLYQKTTWTPNASQKNDSGELSLKGFRVLSYRHPERSRGIFYVVAVLCTYEAMIKSRGCFGCSSSDALRLTVVQGRFLATLEMTRGGRTVKRGRVFSLFVSPTFSAKRSHSLRKECLKNHHFPPILSAFSHRLAARGSSMDFFKNKRVSPHFLQI
mgnify:CR=1 FL=1